LKKKRILHAYGGVKFGKSFDQGFRGGSAATRSQSERKGRSPQNEGAALVKESPRGRRNFPFKEAKNGRREVELGGFVSRKLGPKAHKLKVIGIRLVKKELNSHGRRSWGGVLKGNLPPGKKREKGASLETRIKKFRDSKESARLLGVVEHFRGLDFSGQKKKRGKHRKGLSAGRREMGVTKEKRKEKTNKYKKRKGER